MRHPSNLTRPSSFLLLLALGPMAPAWAGWSSNPVEVRPTLSSIPLVAAANDGGFGTFVAWQEEAIPGSGMVRVRHLLPTGDPDPAWPVDGAIPCDAAAARPGLGVLADRVGGCYVWWTESGVGDPALFLTRLAPDGTTPTGWPTRGLGLGHVSTRSPRPCAIADGANGIYLVWSEITQIRAHHLGLDALGAGGWSNAPHVLQSGAAEYWWPALALGDDGGVFMTFAALGTDTVDGTGLFLRRLDSDGANAAGWVEEGKVVGPFRPWVVTTYPKSSLLDVSPDGRGGVFVFAGSLWEDAAGYDYADLALHRYQGDGQEAPAWPPEGRPLSGYADLYFYDNWGGPDAGIRVHADGQDGALVEARTFYSDAPPIMRLSRCTDAGAWSSLMEGLAKGRDLVLKEDGGAFMADFKGVGPASPWDWNAFLRVDQSNAGPGWTPLLETHTEPLMAWYGDIALASSGDGGAVFFWSQKVDRLGLFARRFGPEGEVTGVAPPKASALALHGLRFRSAAGVIARVEVPEGSARIDLFDLAGRRLSSRSIETAGVVEVALPGTASLRSGVYFARLSSAAASAHGKIAVLR